jgi:hypothetical protein
MSVERDRRGCARIICGISLILIFAYALFGCNSIDKIYIEADLATYSAIAPEYSDYVDKDEDLTDDEKQDRYALLDSWLRRIYSVDLD